MKALIIVDMQNGFLPGGTLPVKDGNKIIPTINFVQESFDIIVATQDWHPPNHISFAANHKDKNPFETIDLENEKTQTLWPIHCVQGTNDAKLSDYLYTNKVNAVIRKGMNPNVDSYSAFFDNNKENSTGLHGYLKNLNVDEVYVCGLAADFCVYYTIKDALYLGYKTFLITDAVKAVDDENYNKIIKPDLNISGCKFISSDNIWEKLQS